MTDRAEQPVVPGLVMERPATTEDMVSELRDLVRHGRRRWKAMVLLGAASLAVAALLGYLWLVFLLDNVFHLAVWGRVAANFAFLLGVAWQGVRLARSWRRSNFTEDQVALAIEQHTPGGVENRLINAIQISRKANGSGAGAPMDRLVVHENYQFLQHVHVHQSAQARSALAWTAAALVGVLSGVLFWTLGTDRFANAATRIFLPFADVAPVYRTLVTVSPGNVRASAGQDVSVRIHVTGRMPESLLILTSRGGARASRKLALDGAARDVTHIFPSVEESITYAVRGGDYTTPYYHIHVPTPLGISRMSATLSYPDYIGQPDRHIESTAGDLEALADTRAAVTFSLNQPATNVWLNLLAAESPGGPSPEAASESSRPGRDAVTRVPLRRTAEGHYAGEFVFRDVAAYSLECETPDGSRLQGATYKLRVLTDNPPELQLAGIRDEAEAMIDEVFELSITARDDYGLAEAGLFYRPKRPETGAAPAAQNGANGDWEAVRVWPCDGQAVDLKAEHALVIGMLAAVEGDVLEVAARARDIDPAKGGLWTTGPRFEIRLTSPGAELQILYEKLLSTEADLRGLIRGHEELTEQADVWARKLGPLSGLRWDEKQNLDALAEAMRQQAATQSGLREQAARTAREMAPEQGGTLPIALGMLADTELVRGIRILEKVAGRDNPQDMRSALLDASLTQQRTNRSLRTMLEKHVAFRKDWELSHMVSFTEMLAKRQVRMADASLACAGLTSNAVSRAQQRVVGLRQAKVKSLAGLAEAAFKGMAESRDFVGDLLAGAFRDASGRFESSGLKPRMQEAAELLERGAWHGAEPLQRSAGDSLAAIHGDLVKAQKAAARQALAALQELAETSVEAQEALAKLQAGTDKNLIEFEEDLSLEEIIHMVAMAEELKKQHELDTGRAVEDYMFEDKFLAWVTTPNYAVVDVNTLRLGEEPSGDGKDYPNSSDREANASQTSIQEKFEDLVGDLLEEADHLREDYETYNINTSWGCADPGVVGKKAGDINGTGATSTTGNTKPPTANIGGASRAGRLGARAHGLVVGDDMINRRGRDEAQEGQEELADQGGEMIEEMSDDPQKDASTGIGGKLIRSDQTSFSLKEAGEWNDDIVDKLQAPQAKNQIVERKGQPLAANIAAMMVDLQSEQEQVIERIKAIRKELDQLYLPTDHLDDIMDELRANLDRLGEQPDGDVFRRQVELLDKLKSTVVVFSRPTSEYEQALQREQVVRGRVLDEPARPAFPGYEDAVSVYYQRLSGLRAVLP